LLDFFGRHPGTVDELALFMSATHPPLPLDEMERETERLHNFLPRVREGVMQTGINILSTMGYHDENLPRSLKDPWQRFMDISWENQPRFVLSDAP
jgi:hypothetical protein